MYFGGYANATNDELLAFLKTPYGILAIVILSLLALFLIFTEFAVLIIISYFAHKRQKVKLRPILYKTVTYFTYSFHILLTRIYFICCRIVASFKYGI
ncbi:glycerophosphoryl diester phosphodiesterase membrane domain-containing protein [Bacillus cereus]